MSADLHRCPLGTCMLCDEERAAERLVQCQTHRLARPYADEEQEEWTDADRLKLIGFRIVCGLLVVVIAVALYLWLR